METSYNLLVGIGTVIDNGFEAVITVQGDYIRSLLLTDVFLLPQQPHNISQSIIPSISLYHYIYSLSNYGNNFFKINGD